MLPGNEKFNAITVGSFSVARETAFLFASVIFALVIRCIYVPVDSVINGDGVYYTILGERFVSGDFGGGISAYWSPLYSVLTGIASLFFHDREFPGRFVSIAAGSMLVIPAYYLIRDFFGRNPAIVGTILLIVHPFLIKSSGWVMTESTYTLILTSCVWFGWKALSTGVAKMYLVTGLLLGTAFLTKPEAFGYLVLLFVLMLGAKMFGCSRPNGLRQAGASYLILLLGFAFFSLPYLFYLHHKTGQWTLSAKIAVNLPAADFEGEFLAVTRDGRTTLKDRIWGDDYDTEYLPAIVTPAGDTRPETFDLNRLRNDVAILGGKAMSLLRKQVRNYFPGILPIPFAVLAIIGLFRKPWTRLRAAKEIYLFSFVLCTLVGYALSAVELRYLFPIVPILIAWAAHGIVEFSEWLNSSAGIIFKGRTGNRAIVTSCVLLILLISSTSIFFNVLEPGPITNVPFEEKEAGVWIKARTGAAQSTVMSANITPAFYAEAKHLYIPDEDLPTIVEYAKSRGVNYLVFSERRMRDADILAGANLLKDATLVYHDQKYADHQIFVYELH